MQGRCKQHGIVEGIEDRRGRLRCSVERCRKLLAALTSETPTHVAPKLVPIEIVPPNDLAQDPDVRRYQKALAIVNYQRAIREAQRPLDWEAGLNDLGGFVQSLTERLESLETRIADLADRVYSGPTGLTGFKCNNCGTRGTVAYSVRCTSCNNDTHWGWYPKQSGS